VEVGSNMGGFQPLSGNLKEGSNQAFIKPNGTLNIAPKGNLKTDGMHAYNVNGGYPIDQGQGVFGNHSKYGEDATYQESDSGSGHIEGESGKVSEINNPEGHSQNAPNASYEHHPTFNPVENMQ
jgi:hypothetical protein